MQRMTFDTIYFFGRFNFPHLGYLYVIRETLLQLQPRSGVTVVFSAEKATWNKHAIPMDTRLAMFELAVQELPQKLQSQVHFSCIEKNLKYGGYTFDTLKELQQKRKEHCGIVMGADAALGIPDLHPGFSAWKNWNDILARADLIIVPRGRYADANAVQEHLPPQLLGKNVHILTTHPTDKELHASSTLVQQGEMSYLPQKVKNYCLAHNLLVQ
jgi:nicotinate (nicotinamide) nucleotide adenylyltransferase